MGRHRLLLGALCLALAATAYGTGEPTLVRDIVPGYDSFLTGLEAAGDAAYVSVARPDRGADLWRSDGTAAGTTRVVSTRPRRRIRLVSGTESRHLFFEMRTSDDDLLWWTDGTPEGTELLEYLDSDRCRGRASGVRLGDRALFVYNGYLFASDDAGEHIGTLIDAYERCDTSLIARLGASAFFLHENGGETWETGVEGDAELWKSDGTLPGTQRVAVLAWPSGDWPAFFALTAASDRLFFAACDDLCTLWASDGTADGTHTVTAFDPDVVAGPASARPQLLTLDGILYFVAADPGGQAEWWTSDGTGPGTGRVTNSALVARLDVLAMPAPPRIGGAAFFASTDADAGTELWKTDGTDAGTLRVADLNPGPASSSPSRLTVAGGQLFFAASGPGPRPALWRTDGTAAGTTIVLDLAGAPRESRPSGLTRLGDGVVFAATDPAGDTELWRSDGTEAGTVRVADLNPSGSSRPASFVELNGRVLFTADAGTGRRLWWTDGTADGTRPALLVLADAVPGRLVRAGAHVFLTVQAPPEQAGLWRTDGSAAGTVRLTTTATLENATDVGGTLFFSEARSATQFWLWRTDGTAAGTAAVQRFNFALRDFTAAGAALFFRQERDPRHGMGNPYGLRSTELWKSDGTPAGTNVVATLPSGVRGFTFMRDAFFLVTAADSLTRVDLTGAITPVAELLSPRPTTGGVSPSDVHANLTVVDGLLYFIWNGWLWRSDGTGPGTLALLDLERGNNWSRTRVIAGVGSRAYVAVPEGSDVEQLRLWSTDGTAQGTAPVGELVGVEGAGFELVTAGRTLFIAGPDAIHGSELFSLPFDPPAQPACTADGCDDDDACSRDRCEPDGCRHDPPASADVTTCVLEPAAQWPDDCPAAVTARLTRVHRLAVRAAASDRPARQVRLTQRALRVLHRAGVLAARRLRRAPDCASQLDRAHVEASRRAARWLGRGDASN